MNDDEIVRQGNLLIHEEARRKHEQIQWRHEETMSKIANQNFDLFQVFWVMAVSCAIGLVLGSRLFGV